MSPIRHRLILRAAALLCGASLTHIAGAASDQDAPKKPATVEVTVSADAPAPLEKIGRTVISREEVKRQVPGNGDLNQLAQTVPGVQFDSAAGALGEDDILNLRPALLSIGGAQPTSNSFLLDGLSTSSMRDSSNTNMHHYIEVVGHPQSTFVNPQLIDKVTIFTHDIPVEFGQFTGGVFSAELRDPSGRWGTQVGTSYSSDKMTHYLTAPEHRSATMPNKEQFERHSLDLSLDVPISSRTSALIGWSREQATLSESQNHASYGTFQRSAKTISDNFTAKVLHRLSDTTKLRFTTVYSPYEQENFEQSLKKQFNTGWTHKLELTRETADTTLQVHVGSVWGDTSREQETNLYTYRNFGANDSVNWVAATATSGIRGGFGDINSTQWDLPVSAKFTWRATDTGTLSAGADFTHSDARYERPETSSAYRHQSTPSALNPLVVSGDGANDLTVIAGEQALNYRIVYEAFSARVKLNTADAWVQWADRGNFRGLPWSYRAGLRYDTNDLLQRHDVAPRLIGTISPLSWMTLHAGWNRYYSNSFLSYALREKYPDNYIYTRTGRSENGKLVFYAADWTLYSHSRSASYSDSKVSTPYSDETSVGATLDFRQFGQANLTYVERRGRDAFSRDAGTRESYINEKTGATAYYTLYRLTNSGTSKSSEYTLSWQKKWARQTLEIATSFEDIETTIRDPFTEVDPSEYDQLVYYNGALVPRSQVGLEAENYARPHYVTFKWSSDWFNRRLKVDLLGRWNTAYTALRDSGTSITVSGVAYDRYEDLDVPANLINSLNIHWLALETTRGSLALELKISNVFDRLPHSTSATTTNPYQQGRTFWAGATYTF